MLDLNPIINNENYPSLTVRYKIRDRSAGPHTAYFDSGFDGALAIPHSPITLQRLGDHDSTVLYKLSNGSLHVAPIYFGTLTIEGLTSTNIPITISGGLYRLGRQFMDDFEITFDRGRRIILKP